MTLLLLMTSGDDSPRTRDCHAVGAGPWRSLCAALALAVAFFAAGGYDEVVATRVNDARSVTATLAAAVGRYGEFVPPLSLRQHVSCVWLYQLPARPAGPLAVVPDGCIDLRWSAGRLSVDGPHRAVTLDLPAPGALVVGLRFQPGAAPHWLGVPASDLVDHCIALEDVWGAPAQHLGEWVGEAQTPAGVIRRLEDAMIRRAAMIAPPDEEIRHVFALLSGATGAPVPRVTALVSCLGTSERSLRRRCHTAFGYGPQTLARILRFQRFLGMAYQGRGVAGLARCASMAGYADQAHLCREARRLSGLSPRMIAAQLAR